MANEWNVGKKEVGLKKEIEQAVVVGLVTRMQTEEQVSEYLDELEFLALTAGAETTRRFVQKLDTPDKRTFVGSGKAAEIAKYVEEHENITMVIFDDDLSGKQTSILEEMMKVKIIDRSSLILDIFAGRAQTAQAKTQVELAQMQYMLPRLRGLWTHLERQRGGIGMRGPGETEIETDRRIIRDKISKLKKDLEKLDRQAETRRKGRDAMVRVALVGYTNVGKSTLMNLLTKSEVFAEDKLFATLDTTVRKTAFQGVPFLLTDTVGFIRKLPHHLVESFKSTLDEVRESDILLHVVDVAHPQYDDQIRTVQGLLKDLNASDKPTLLVFNKIDLFRERNYDLYLDQEGREEVEESLRQSLSGQFGAEAILLSAHTRENLDKLRQRLVEMVKEEYQTNYPYVAKQW
ncbi:GTPase HflX [Neolewinella lacunae]|uniref:GTPase HflX n=1 Tax=Neolewinella lacunae TaxID=1517758 RepID=A0A923PNK1_9BACT|nr:GTPase HflX [Neolewinella lacunae]MBC6995705.1 GTPase HflX [Neolewinella lacunae]MDN3636602.1 GTPase HflX [Neolewinella lacunae]